MLELFAAGAMLVGLVIYALTGGADFGGGILDLFATGPRARALRTEIERALAPVWEANHVWLIFVVVVLFTAFPAAFAWIGIELHVPVTILLVAIVLRGAAFVFRQYGPARRQVTWGRVFAASSLLAALSLGTVIAALTTGERWLSGFGAMVGVLTASAFAFLAATYLLVELRDLALREELRRTATRAGGLVAVMAGLCAALAWSAVPGFARDLLTWPLLLVVGAGAGALGASLVALRRRRDRSARITAAASVALLITGWALAHYPAIVAPELTITRAAAPAITLQALVPVVLGGAVIVVPSLWWLLRVFKSQSKPPVPASLPRTPED